MMGEAVRQIPLDLGHRTAYGRDDFLVTPSNQDAVNWIDRWGEWPAPALILYGPPACGKTHLAAVWAELSGAVRIDPSCLEHVEADEIAAKGKHLVIDPIDLWFGERKAETTLFHLYNMMKEQNRTVLFTMRMAPQNADFILADLASRLRAAPAAAIQAPDDVLLEAMMVKLFSDRQLQVGADVIHYIIPRIERSFVAVKELVEAVDHLALVEKRAVSVPLIRRVLLDTPFS